VIFPYFSLNFRGSISNDDDLAKDDVGFYNLRVRVNGVVRIYDEGTTNYVWL